MASASLQERTRFGASHASEIAYVFDNLVERNEYSVAPKDKEVAKLMNNYWVNFAKNGDPNGNGLPRWPVYDPKKNEVFEFKQDGSAANGLDERKSRLNVIEKALEKH